MSATFIFPVLVMVVGLLLWILASNAKLSEIGRMSFQIGLFWTVYALMGHTIHLG